MEMNRFPFPLILILSFLILSATNAETQEAINALVEFMQKLSPPQMQPNWGWNSTSDPCIDRWIGVTCYNNSPTVKKVVLDSMNLTGVIDAAFLCKTKALTVLSLNANHLFDELPEPMSNCSRLTHLYLSSNNFSGNLPVSLSRLKNLKRVDVSGNGFSGGIPNMLGVSGLLTFLAERNRLSGIVPSFDFSNLEEFNVSYNELSGQIPDLGGRFDGTSFLSNPGLCGKPLDNACPASAPPGDGNRAKGGSSSSMKDVFMYSGYALIGLLVLFLIAFKLFKKRVVKETKDVSKQGIRTDRMQDIGSSSDSKGFGENRSEFSITSAESVMGSSSLCVLSNPVVSGLKFEDLLRSPAELIGRGRRGSMYKVTINEGVTLVVKRIREWEISRDDFKKRMQRIDEARHPNVMPIIAFYCSKQEKLLVYEFQENGSLFNLLHGSHDGRSFDWGSRLTVAAKISEALAFMNEKLQADGISHGNLKSSNILLSKEMEPLISEYGLAQGEDQDLDQDQSFPANIDSFQETDNSPPNRAFQTDTYNLGVILLELLTGKLVQNNGFELARWVNSAIREEWTVEVFDKALVSEGANEEKLVHLLQVALKCINASSDVRPIIREVAGMIKCIRELDDEKSITFDR